MCKLIMLDLDDTLLNDQRELSLVNKNSLIKAQKSGIKVALSSGRPTFAMKSLAKELRLEQYGGFLISFNGADVYDCSEDRTIHNVPLPVTALQELYKISMSSNVYMQTYINDEIVATANNKYTDIEKEITGMNIRIPSNYENIFNSEVTKVILLENPEKLKQLEDELKNFVKNELSMTISKPFFLEFMNFGIDKGVALEKLAAYLNIKTKEVIAFGDSYNDIPMLLTDAYSVAMDNSVREVKEICDHVTTSNNDHGVSKFLEQYILNN